MGSSMDIIALIRLVTVSGILDEMHKYCKYISSNVLLLTYSIIRWNPGLLLLLSCFFIENPCKPYERS